MHALIFVHIISQFFAIFYNFYCNAIDFELLNVLTLKHIYVNTTPCEV